MAVLFLCTAKPNKEQASRAESNIGCEDPSNQKIEALSSQNGMESNARR